MRYGNCNTEFYDDVVTQWRIDDKRESPFQMQTIIFATIKFVSLLLLY